MPLIECGNLTCLKFLVSSFYSGSLLNYVCVKYYIITFCYFNNLWEMNDEPKNVLLLCPGRGVEYCDQFVCLCVREHIAGPTFTKFFLQIPCGRGSVFLWWRCNTLCTSGLMDDVTFGCHGLYCDAWQAEPLTFYH